MARNTSKRRRKARRKVYTSPSGQRSVLITVPWRGGSHATVTYHGDVVLIRRESGPG